ncbi:hypothetical protein GKZ90_0005735 [Flavobacterium sp. MC2016-06]|uniref:hypothetical protein n=1 Tax=Flavobacterium sp. MC2016-06 TaxID=2676308 RepID=UPI0012BB099D|nr:hypothetical protein [Flavobacterium sp. MC2016-06]MBU3857639.1 hypothetical protein [Flavobacterium sp. MC2016-06]
MEEQDQIILVFKTSVKFKKDIIRIKNTFNLSKELKICFDLEDCDKIMRTEGNLYTADEIITKIKKLGYQCEELK